MSNEEELQLAAAAVTGLNNVVNMVQGISSNVKGLSNLSGIRIF